MKQLIKADELVNALLLFKDGTFLFGKKLGCTGEVIGEICFNTSMTGYQEIMTDPSYNGQIINFTCVHIGNTGVNNQDMEGKKIHAKSLIIQNEVSIQSNYRATDNFVNWLKQNNIVAISHIDTRFVTKMIVEKGVQPVLIKHYQNGEVINVENETEKLVNETGLLGKELTENVASHKITHWMEQTPKMNYTIENDSTNHSNSTDDKNSNSDKKHDVENNIDNYNTQNVDAENTQIKSKNRLTNNKKYPHITIAVLDFGIKYNILRCLKDYNVNLILLPGNTSFPDLVKYNVDGVLLSNGPGDPASTIHKVKDTIHKIIDSNIPLFGICLGHQLLALASGLTTEKMKQGHRGANHPVQNLETKQVEITSQNHGFCVKNHNVPDNIDITHISLYDNTIEGIKIKDKKAFSVQYHPESSPGPHDSKYLFTKFITIIDSKKKVL